MESFSDFDPLKIPAFMRKGFLRRKKKIAQKNESAQEPVLTALDRKKAGMMPPELMIRKSPKIEKKTTVRRKRVRAGATTSNFNAATFESAHLNLFERTDFVIEQNPKKRQIRGETETISPGLQSAIKKPRKRKKSEVSHEAESTAAAHSPQIIGTVTHFFPKIGVAVILLSSSLSVGDTIQFESDQGPYEQILDSMQIDRKPVFKAGAQEEIGIKLKKSPIIGCTVYRISG